MAASNNNPLSLKSKQPMVSGGASKQEQTAKILISIFSISHSYRKFSSKYRYHINKTKL